MSLIDSANFPSLVSFSNGSSYNFLQLFMSCAGLTDASNLRLPATTLSDGCYEGLFISCTNLTAAPELPAPTLANYCYSAMFFGCSSLSEIKCLATDISASSPCNGWVDGVAASGTFTKPSSMTSWPSGINGIPNGWSIIDV